MMTMTEYLEFIKAILVENKKKIDYNYKKIKDHYNLNFPPPTEKEYFDDIIIHHEYIFQLQNNQLIVKSRRTNKVYKEVLEINKYSCYYLPVHLSRIKIENQITCKFWDNFYNEIPSIYQQIISVMFKF